MNATADGLGVCLISRHALASGFCHINRVFAHSGSRQNEGGPLMSMSESYFF